MHLFLFSIYLPIQLKKITKYNSKDLCSNNFQFLLFVFHFAFLPFSHTNKANSNTSKQTRTNIDPPIQSLCLFPLVPLDQTNKLHLKLHINLVKSQKKKKTQKIQRTLQ